MEPQTKTAQIAKQLKAKYACFLLHRLKREEGRQYVRKEGPEAAKH